MTFASNVIRHLDDGSGRARCNGLFIAGAPTESVAVCGRCEPDPSLSVAPRAGGTDWKAVADELTAYVMGLGAGGGPKLDIHEVRRESIRANTR